MIKFKVFLFLFLLFAFTTGVLGTGCSTGLFGSDDAIVQNISAGGTNELGLVKYTPGIVEPVVFVHFSDSHFGLATGQGIPITTVLLGYVAPRINPAAVIHTGDMVDQGYVPSSWDSYKAVTGSQNYPKYVDIPGNHDVKVSGTGDGRKFLVTNSVTGKPDDKFYGITNIDNTIPVCLIRTNTAASPTNNNTQNINGYYTETQNAYIFAKLASSPPAAFNIILAHHPIAAIPGNESAILKEGSDYMVELINKVNAPLYLCGHVHEPALIWLGKTLVAQADDFGKNGLPSSFYLISYDMTTGPAAKLVKVNAANSPIVDWPIVFITSPADSGLAGVNPYAVTYPSGRSNPKLKAMVYTEYGSNTGLTVSCSIGTGSETPVWNALTNTSSSLWEYTIPVNNLKSGTNKVTVRATQNGKTVEQVISIKIN